MKCTTISFGELIIELHCLLHCETATRNAGRMKGQGGQLFNKGHFLNKYIFTIRTRSSASCRAIVMH